MNQLQKMLIFCLVIGFLASCGEPQPLTQTTPTFHQHPNTNDAIMDLHISSSNESQKNLVTLFQEVFHAEFERSSWTFENSADQKLSVKLESYQYISADSNEWIPGCLIPGLIPFGPLSVWWWFSDDEVQTPALEITVSAMCNGESINVSTKVIRSVAREEDLARVAFSEVSRQIRSWLKGASIK